MTLEQLKDRIEATCNKNGIFDLHKVCLEQYEGSRFLYLYIELQSEAIQKSMPNTELLLEAVDLECRAIKARQSSASNGIDE